MCIRKLAWTLRRIVLSVSVSARAANGVARSDRKPFGGTWTLGARQRTAAHPEVRVITVGEGWMRIEIHRDGDDHPPVLIYNLDGTTRTNPYGAGTATTAIRREQS